MISVSVKLGRGVMLTTHPHLVPRSEMSRSYTPLPPSASVACSGTAFYLCMYSICSYVSMYARVHACRSCVHMAIMIQCVCPSINAVTFWRDYRLSLSTLDDAHRCSSTWDRVPRPFFWHCFILGAFNTQQVRVQSTKYKRAVSTMLKYFTNDC
jgi:hypothetical protein